MDKKTIIGVSVFFAVVIAIMFALIPVELKNQKYEKWGKLAEAAETNSMAQFIIENEELYTEDIIDLYYGNNDNLEFVYNYAFHKDDYDTMTFTDEELNSEKIPVLYMDDPRWGYEYIYDTTIFENGCSAVAFTMANLYLNHNNNIDPVIFMEVAKALDAIAFPEGVMVMKMSEIADIFDLNAEGVDCTVDKKTGFVEHEDLISVIDDKEAVLLIAVSSDVFGSHMLLVRDYSDDGYYINDPANPEHSATVWPFEDIEKDIRYYWKVTKK